VLSRLKPLEPGEKRSREFFHDEISVQLGSSKYFFDSVFDASSTQDDVFLHAEESLLKFVQGYNCAIFAYGQTASGKTYTIQGDLCGSAEYFGLAPKIINNMFIEILNVNCSSIFLKASFFEIYNETIFDLLNPKKTNLQIYAAHDGSNYVKGVTSVYVSDYDEAIDIYKKGVENRKISGTKMNSKSSRSHSIFQITLKQIRSDDSQVTSCLYLVDLAGSEQIGKTGATGKILTEAKHINLSLMSLSTVIKQLQEKKAHISYRNSKLTRILKQALGGNSQALIIVCLSQCILNESETKSTLQFSQRARAIKNDACINYSLSADELKNKLDAALKEKDYWQSRYYQAIGEIEMWRAGRKVPPEDQFKLTDKNVSGTTRILEYSANIPINLSQNASLDCDNIDDETYDESDSVDDLPAFNEEMLELQENLRELKNIALRYDQNGEKENIDVTNSSDLLLNEKLFFDYRKFKKN